MRRYPSSKVRSSGCALLEEHEEIPHVQGKRNPSKMLGTERGHQRADTLKLQSQTPIQSYHSLVNQLAFSNSVKLSHAMWGHPRWVHHGGEV